MPLPWSWFICICIFPSLSLPLLRTQCWQGEKWRNKICIKTEKYDLHEHGSPKQMPWVHLWHEEPFRRPNTETLPFKRQIAKLNVFKTFFYSLALLPLKVLWCYWWYWCRSFSLLMSGASKQADSHKVDRCHKSTLTLLWAKTITFLQTPLWVVPCSMTGFSVWVHPAGSLCDPPLVPATPGEPPVHIVTKTGHKKTPSVDDGFCGNTKTARSSTFGWIGLQTNRETKRKKRGLCLVRFSLAFCVTHLFLIFPSILTGFLRGNSKTLVTENLRTSWMMLVGRIQMVEEV